LELQNDIYGVFLYCHLMSKFCWLWQGALWRRNMSGWSLL